MSAESSTASSSRSTLRIAIISLAIALPALVFFASRLLPDAVTLRNKCRAQLTQLGIAFANYHDEHRCFPPAYVADQDGQPMHSWRVLLLRSFKNPEMDALYDAYNFDEPWNGPHNRLLADKIPDVYRCGAEPATTNSTSYLAVVDPRTVWPGADCVKQRNITDGSLNTIMLFEVADSKINWLDPRDLTFEEALELARFRSSHANQSGHQREGTHVLCADGICHWLPDKTEPELIRKLLTRAGDEVIVIPSGGWVAD